MSREEFIEVFDMLAEEGAIVEDGTWTERYVDRILDPEQAAVAVVEAINDEEVMAPHSIAIALKFIESVPRSAVAAAARNLWLAGGIFSEAQGLVADVFRDALKASTTLMTPAELIALGELPEYVKVFRGQLHGDLSDEPSGMSWTVSEEVADWYAAPIPGQTLRGCVLSATVPRGAVLALFLERGESELVIDLDLLDRIPVESRVGRCDKFPLHLQGTKSWFF